MRMTRPPTTKPSARALTLGLQEPPLEPGSVPRRTGSPTGSGRRRSCRRSAGMDAATSRPAARPSETDHWLARPGACDGAAAAAVLSGA
ncbi:MAG: hypothetical protein ACKVI4_15450 [Actinomycetales bacterium]